MTDRESRERLIELIRQAKKITKGANCDLEREMLFADHLLANGVIVPPCKVGDIVWNVCADDIVRPWKVKFRTYDDREGWWIFLDWEGEDRHAKCSGDYFREKYFLTREEAEARLRETTLMKNLPTKKV